MKKLWICHGRIIDPANQIDRVGTLEITDNRITAITDRDANSHPDEAKDVEIIEAAGRIVAPGLIDLHVHFREPGQSAKESIETGSRCAAAGGFTSVVCMPNTSPSVDTSATVTWLHERAKAVAVVNVFTTGALTKGLAGEELAPIGSMFRAGIVGVTDDGHCVQNHELMRRAVEYATMFNLTIMDHCQDYNLVGNGVMNEGHWSTLLGLPGWPAAGEEIIVMRNILLAELCKARIHCQHLSAAGSVRLLREAKKRGVSISGELCPHHIALTDESIRAFDSNFKMNPPLRAEADVEALIEGVADGTIEILASDHAPHCAYEKEVEFDCAPFGILGLETELGLFLDILIHQKKAIDLPRLIELYTINPAKLLNLDRGTLSVGAVADVTVIDPDLEWRYDVTMSESKSRNTPFHAREIKGRAVRTIVGGRSVWNLDAPKEFVSPQT